MILEQLLIWLLKMELFLTKILCLVTQLRNFNWQIIPLEGLMLDLQLWYHLFLNFASWVLKMQGLNLWNHRIMRRIWMLQGENISFCWIEVDLWEVHALKRQKRHYLSFLEVCLWRVTLTLFLLGQDFSGWVENLSKTVRNRFLQLCRKFKGWVLILEVLRSQTH